MKARVAWARLWAWGHRIERLSLPLWATPLAIASLASLVVQSMDHQYIRTQQILALVITCTLGVLLASLYMALSCDTRRFTIVGRRPLTAVLIALLAANTLIHLVLVVPHLAQDQRYYTNDAVAVTDCAARQYLAGENPYKNVHMLTCLDKHGLGASSTTPKQAGAFWIFHTYPSPASAHFNWLQYHIYIRELDRERHDPTYMSPDFEGRFNYPGGALLLAIPALLFVLRDLVPLYLGCTVLASILIYRRAAPRIRPVVGMLLLSDTPLLLDGAGGLTDASYALLLVLYWFNRHRPITAGIILGLAAATRQQVWFFIPFLLFLAWRTHGWSDLRTRAPLAGAVFLACNLPFLLLGPGDWLTGVLGPVRDPLFALGVGLITLSIAKVLPLWAAATYLKLELIAYALCFWLFTRRWRTAPALALLLPLIPMALAWRSLHTYFMFLPLLALAALVDPDQPTGTDTDPAEGNLMVQHTAGSRRPLRWGLIPALARTQPAEEATMR